MRLIITCMVFCVIGSRLMAQQGLFPLNQQLHSEMLANQEKNSALHTAFRPLNLNKLKLSKVTGFQSDSTEHYYWLTQKLFKEDLVKINKDGVHVVANPLFNFYLAKDIEDTSNTNLYINTRGFIIKGDIGEKVSFETRFYETQARFPNYISNYIKDNGVFNGKGRIKPFKTDGYDYAYAEGFVGYVPIDNLNLRFGHGKHFIGNGYRSILLSDFTHNYVYGSAQVYFFKNKLQYNTVWAGMHNFTRIPQSTTPEALYKPKSATFHYLEYNLNKNISLGLFEGIIWQRWDSSGTLAVNPLQYNPLPGLSLVEAGVNKPNSAVVGVNANVLLGKHATVYGQFAQTLNADKSKGYQLGSRVFIGNFNFLVEYNVTDENMYNAFTSLQNYTHFAEPLGYALGSAKQEILCRVNYAYKRVRLSAMLSVVKKMNNYPRILILPGLSYYDNRTYANGVVGYVINPKTNLQLQGGLTLRTASSDISPTINNVLINVGLSTNLSNRYKDI